MLAIIGRQVEVMSNWFVQSPNDTRSCRIKVDGSAFDDFSSSSMHVSNNRDTVWAGVMSNWFVQIPKDTRSCRRKVDDQLLMISVLLLCWQ